MPCHVLMGVVVVVVVVFFAWGARFCFFSWKAWLSFLWWKTWLCPDQSILLVCYLQGTEHSSTETEHSLAQMFVRSMHIGEFVGLFVMG